jgi:hypothetical protein
MGGSSHSYIRTSAEDKMDGKENFNHQIATLADGLILIWWGVVIVVDPLTIGLGAIVTGLILLGLNGIRLLKGIPTKTTTTILGLVALVWGAFDHAFGLDFWHSFAVLLIVIGFVQIGYLLVGSKTDQVEITQ